MIAGPHLMTGFVITASAGILSFKWKCLKNKIILIPAICLFSLMSHYVLDSVPHWDYSISGQTKVAEFRERLGSTGHYSGNLGPIPRTYSMADASVVIDGSVLRLENFQAVELSCMDSVPIPMPPLELDLAPETRLNFSHITCEQDDTINVYFAVTSLPNAVNHYGEVSFIVNKPTSSKIFGKLALDMGIALVIFGAIFREATGRILIGFRMPMAYRNEIKKHLACSRKIAPFLLAGLFSILPDIIKTLGQKLDIPTLLFSESLHKWFHAEINLEADGGLPIYMLFYFIFTPVLYLLVRKLEQEEKFEALTEEANRDYQLLEPSLRLEQEMPFRE